MMGGNILGGSFDGQEVMFHIGRRVRKEKRGVVRISGWESQLGLRAWHHTV